MTLRRWIAAAAVVVALGTCASDGAEPAVPPFTPPASAALTPSEPIAPDPTGSLPAQEREVAAAYLAYLAAVDQLLAGGPPDAARLADVATPEEALRIATNSVPLKSAGQVVVGATVVLEVAQVSLDGNSATVQACVDGGGLSVVAADATATAGSSSVPASTALVDLVRHDGVWRVGRTRSGGSTCG